MLILIQWNYRDHLDIRRLEDLIIKTFILAPLLDMPLFGGLMKQSKVDPEMRKPQRK